MPLMYNMIAVASKGQLKLKNLFVNYKAIDISKYFR